ncbi:MAG: phosphate ABC transporter substrate-binding protein PstS [Desulfomonilaceae bacterium]
MKAGRTIMSGSLVVVALVAALFLLVPAAGSLCNAAGPIAISGAGATFPYPIYSAWAHEYQKKTGVQLNYQSIGSGGGIAQIKAKTVNFGASDEPLKKDVLVKHGLIQWPMVMGGVVPVTHVKGIEKGKLKLTPELLSEIYLGKITNWKDEKVKKVNPDLKLPDQAIVVVHRSDGSGTTWIFTSYLSAISKEWKEKVGSANAVSWPAGIGGKGNEGVSAFVQRTNGGIGYVEFAYALQNNLVYAQLQNKAGKFVEPTIDTFKSAAANADWKNAPMYYISLVNQPGEKSWPIVGATYILFYKEQPDAAKAEAILKFFSWCYDKGDEMAAKLLYIPLPKNVVELVKATWKADVKSGDKPVWK